MINNNHFTTGIIKLILQLYYKFTNEHMHVSILPIQNAVLAIRFIANCYTRSIYTFSYVLYNILKCDIKNM